jgi:hypothetical protein
VEWSRWICAKTGYFDQLLVSEADEATMTAEIIGAFRRRIGAAAANQR